MRRGGRARRDPEEQQVADPRRQLQRGDPLARRDVEVLEALRVRRPVGVVAAGGGEQRRDRALELAEIADVDRQRALDPLLAEAPPHARRQRVVLARDSVAVGLGPHVALHVGEPGTAHVEVESAQRAALHPHAPADPVARLEHPHRAAAGLQLAGRDEAREAGADDEDVDHGPGSYRVALR